VFTLYFSSRLFMSDDSLRILLLGSSFSKLQSGRAMLDYFVGGRAGTVSLLDITLF